MVNVFFKILDIKTKGNRRTFVCYTGNIMHSENVLMSTWLLKLYDCLNIKSWVVKKLVLTAPPKSPAGYFYLTIYFKHQIFIFFFIFKSVLTVRSFFVVKNIVKPKLHMGNYHKEYKYPCGNTWWKIHSAL